MKEYDNYRVHCLLKEIMRQKGISVGELHRRSGVSRDTIAQLRKNAFKGLSKRSIERICGALDITVSELFVVMPEDIWLPIRRAKEVTIHVGLRSWNEPRPARRGVPVMGMQFIGGWDFRASMWISEYLMGLKLDIRVRFQEHITGAGRGVDPAVRASAQAIFGGGNHIVIGSPIANQFTEEVVCHAYGVPPYNPEVRSIFPYAFEWDNWRQVRSSIGRRGERKEFGIAELPSNKIVAPHVIVPSGEGTDGALIVVYRVFNSPAQRVVGNDDERIVICLLGDSGLATSAAARLATNPAYAAGLYPPARMVPRMRAVKCTYTREPSDALVDNREVKDAILIPERKAAGAAAASPPRQRAVGGKPHGLR